MLLGEIDGVDLSSRIHVPKTSEIVADKIRAQIIRGELNEGDSLPPEGQLIDSLGISRPTLREAFRILEAEGLISVVRGSRTGAKVHKPSVDLVSRYAGYVLESQGTTIADLYQARLAIEPSVVRWLATDKGGGSLPKLRSLLAAMEAVDAGVTTTVDWSHGLQTTDHAEAAVDALTEVPGRFVLAYGNIQQPPWEWSAAPARIFTRSASGASTVDVIAGSPARRSRAR